jgi:hypothetical protein
MAQESFNPNDTDFEDALIEIAGEIEYLNSVQKRVITDAPQVSLKSEIEAKRAESTSYNLFQLLKTIEEVQNSSGKLNSLDIEPQSLVTSKHIPSTKGKTNLYQSITITESPMNLFEEDNIHTTTSDDLFEEELFEGPPENVLSSSLDPNEGYEISTSSPESQTYAMSSRENPVTITGTDNASEHSVISNTPSTKSPKSIDIPSRIFFKFEKKIGGNEREIFKNFMKLQKK